MIIFEWIRWKNFLSTGNNWNEVHLNKNPTTLIVGANGHGKSTLLDALTFALFGKPFRNINKPNLVNSVNGKGLVVELMFSIGPKKYKIVRGIAPAIFEVYIDEELVDQDALGIDYQKYLEDSILKFKHKAFTQIGILGSKSFIPFMKLKAAERRNIIEDLLDIEIFSSMNKIAKENYTKAKDDVVANKVAIDNAKDKIVLQQKYAEDAKKNTQEQIDSILRTIASLAKIIETNSQGIIEADAQIAAATEISAKTQLNINQLSEYETLGIKIATKIAEKEKQVKFFEVNDNCPTCQQLIAKDFKANKIEDLQFDIKRRGIGLAELNAKLTIINEQQDYMFEAMKQKNMYQQSTSGHLERIRLMNVNIEELKNKNLLSDEMMDISHKLVEELEQLVAARAGLVEDRAYYEAAVSLLKDGGIKAQIIKQYLPVINNLVNKYLASMDFFVNFELNEEFDETIKSRHRDDFTYDSFSEGEKQKIDIALLFAWRAVAKMKNSLNCNLLIMDEIFDSSLDGTGADLVLSILSTLPEGSNVFVISHRELLHDKFGASIKFEKRNNFSEIVEQEI